MKPIGKLGGFGRSCASWPQPVASPAARSGPDFHEPRPPAVTGYTATPMAEQTASAEVPVGAAQHFAFDQDIPAQWWALFHSQDLNNLIERSLKANPDLQAAQAALKAAHESTLAQVGAYFPSIQGNASRGQPK